MVQPPICGDDLRMVFIVGWQTTQRGSSHYFFWASLFDAIIFLIDEDVR